MAEPLTTELLCDVVKSVMEDAAFILAEPAEAGRFAGKPVLEASLALGGAARGELRLRADGAFGEMLAANLLGDEGVAATPSAASDAMGELLNMVAGAVAARAGGASLGLPRVWTLTADESNGSWQGTLSRAALQTDEGLRLEVAVLPAGSSP